MTPKKSIKDLINVAHQLDDMDTRGLTHGIQNPGASKGASIRTTGATSEAQPQTQQTTPLPTLSPTQIRTQALLKKLLSKVDSRIVTILTTATSDTEKSEARLMLAFLTHQRQSILNNLEQTPEGVTLLESLIDFIDFLEGALDKMGSPGLQPLQPIVRHFRERCSGLILFGVGNPKLKIELKAIRTEVEANDPEQRHALVKRLHQCLAMLNKLESDPKKKGPPSLLTDRL